MGFGRAVGQHILSEKLPRKGKRFIRQRLLGSRYFSRDRTRGIFVILDGEKRFAVGAIEKIDKALLASLRHRVNVLSIMLHGEQHRRCWEVAVPDVVTHSLKMPYSLAAFRVQSEHRISE